MAIRDVELRIGQRDYAALDDRMLVLDFQAGDPEAFVEIHRRYGGLARRVCGRFLRNPQDVEEAFQETMVRVFQGLHRFNGRYALQPWVARIATNVSLDHVRAAARRPPVEEGSIHDDEWPDMADGPEEAYERLVQRDLVLSVLEDMPQNHRAALVLRELDGRSHREIATALGITPSQAKALIHRAKGSFRRGWLRAAAERGGFAGIAFLPLLWLLKAGDLARRLVDRAGQATTQAVQVATPEVVTAAASSPAATTTATGLAERLVAAGVTLVLAGGVTVAAVKSEPDRAAPVDRATPIETQSASPSPAAVVPVPPAAASDEPARSADRSRDPAPAREREGREGGEGRDQEPQAAAETSEPAEAPSPASAPGDPAPTEPPTAPVIPPAPAWTFSFVTAGLSVESCGCDTTPRLVTSSSKGTPSEGVSFAQEVEGAVFDAGDDPTWPFWLSFSGSAGPNGGRLRAELMLASAGGLFWYEANGNIVETTENADGSVVYDFVGAFSLRPDQQPVAGIPRMGRISVSLGVWADGVVYLGSVALDGS